MSVDLVQIVKDIIKSNKYLTLGTADDKPWVAPLYYAVDNDNNFYFISQLDSLHTKHVLKNPTVAFAIFDSHQPEGTGIGVQGSGSVVMLKDNEIKEAFTWYKTTFIEMKPEFFTGDAPYRFFRLVPDHFWVVDPEVKTDKRVEVQF